MSSPHLDVVSSNPVALPSNVENEIPPTFRNLVRELHESIRASDFEAVVRLADSFRKVLRHRMEEEDSPDGLLSSVENSEPRLAPRVQKLREQRRNVFRLLANIRDAATFSLEKTKLLIPLLFLLYRQYERETRRMIAEYYFYDEVGCDGG